jgi:uncharacterized repeat protein (TIGR01451 family)
LEVDITGGAANGRVGDALQYAIALRNTGATAATGVVVNVQYDNGLQTPADAENTGQVTWPRRGSSTTVAAGGRVDVPALPFTINKSGRQCVRVTVTYNEGSPVTRESCVAVAEAAPAREPRIEVSIEAPAANAKGKSSLFKVRVKNAGEIALTNVDLYEEYPPDLLQVRVNDPNAQVVNGTVHRVIPRLDVGQARDFQTECLCLQETRRASVIARAVAQTDPPSVQVSSANEAVFEIGPPGGAAGAGPGPGGVLPPAGARTGLSTKISFSQATVQAGARLTCEISVTNLSPVGDRNVVLAVGFPQDDPPTITPDVTRVEGPQGVTAELRGNLLTFSRLPALGPNETAIYKIPINANKPGIVPVTAKAVSDAVSTPAEWTQNLEIVPRRT